MPVGCPWKTKTRIHSRTTISVQPLHTIDTAAAPILDDRIISKRDSGSPFLYCPIHSKILNRVSPPFCDHQNTILLYESPHFTTQTFQFMLMSLNPSSSPVVSTARQQTQIRKPVSDKNYTICTFAYGRDNNEEMHVGFCMNL